MRKKEITIEVDKNFYEEVIAELKEKLGKKESEIEYGLKFLAGRKIAQDLTKLKEEDPPEKLLNDLELAILHSKQEK